MAGTRATPRRAQATPRSASLPGWVASALLHGLGIALAIQLSQTNRATVKWRAAPPRRLEATMAWDGCIGPVQAPTAPLLAVQAETSPPDPLTDLPEPFREQPAVDEAALPHAQAVPPGERPHDVREWRTPLRTSAAPVTRPEPRTTPSPEVADRPAPSPPGVDAVDASPLPGQNEPPRYPFVAWRRGIEGTVVIELAIDCAGIVATARIERSSGCLALDEAARTQLLRWRFAPARGPTGAIPTTHRQAVVFRIHG